MFILTFIYIFRSVRNFTKANSYEGPVSKFQYVLYNI